MKKQSNLVSLFRSLRPYYVKIVIAIILSVASAIITVVSPQIVEDLCNEIAFTSSVNMKKVTKIGFILVGMYLFGSITQYVSNLIMVVVTQRYAKSMRMDLIKHINKMPLRYFDTRQYGDTLSVITNDVATVSQSIQNSAAMLISSIITVISVIIAMFIKSWQLALTTLSIIPMMCIALVVLLKVGFPLMRKNQESLGKLNGVIEENLSGLLVIKAFNASESKHKLFDERNKEMAHLVYAIQAISGIMMPLMVLIGTLASALVLVVGGCLMNSGASVTFGTITAFLIYVNVLQNPLSQIPESAAAVNQAAAASTRVYAVLDEEMVSNEDSKQTYFVTENDKKVVEGNVEFRNVKFGYNPEKTIIHDFSANVSSGMKVAIVGPTGAGKTTLVNLLMRFYETDSGDILIDGVSIKDMKREEIRDIFGMVLQDTWLFNGTIRENIAFGKDVDDEKIIEIAKEVGIWHYIQTLPGMLDFVIESEDSVSSGERQLLTIARAMVSDNSLLILDEATSNVDTRTEEVIQDAMDKLTLHRTSFVIAHRLSTIKNADLILVMNNGDIVESGNHEELLKLNGVYANLYNSQFVNE